MKVIVDRTEGEMFVVELENGKFANLPRVFAENAKDGDIIDISIDKNETEKRRKTINEKMDKLFKDK